MTLIERAKEAHQEQERINFENKLRRDREERERNEANFKSYMQRKLGIECEPYDRIVTIEGLTFLYLPRYSWGDDSRPEEVVLVEKCEQCGGQIRSFAIDTLAEVGAWLAGGYRMHHQHIESEEEEAGDDEEMDDATERSIEFHNNCL